MKIIFNLQLILNIIFFIYLILGKSYTTINYIIFTIALLILIASLFNPKIKIETIKRTNKFDDLSSDSDIVSASNIREKLKNKKDLKILQNLKPKKAPNTL